MPRCREIFLNRKRKLTQQLIPRVAMLAFKPEMGRNMPPMRNHHKEHRFQKLPKPSPAACLYKSPSKISLATKAGQEKEAHMQITVKGIHALDDGTRTAELVILLPPQEQIKKPPHRPPCVAP
jgi:hypothetical protein